MINEKGKKGKGKKEKCGRAEENKRINKERKEREAVGS